MRPNIATAVVLAALLAAGAARAGTGPYQAQTWSNGAAQIAGSGNSGAAVVSAGTAFSFMRNGVNVSTNNFVIVGQSFNQASFAGFALSGVSNGFKGQ